MNKLSLKDLVFQALIGASYVVLVYVFYTFSFGAVQFRIAEALLVLVFFNKKNAIGILIGTFVANFLGDFGIIDAIFGTLTTYIVIYLMLLFKKHVAIALVWPIVLNAIYVALLLSFMLIAPGESFQTGFTIYGISALWTVALGEAAVIYIIGLPLYYLLKRNKAFVELFE